MAALDGPIQEAKPTGPTEQAPPASGEMASQPGERLRMYVWQVPVRVTHWVTVGSIAVLTVSGGYIADPFLIPPGGSVMATVRFIHMLAAFTFLASGIFRAYWMFAGNRFARWSAFIPTSRHQAGELVRQGQWYLFLRRDAPKVVGHNQLAAAAYLVVFFLFLVQAVTGFALAGAHGTQPWAALFGWVPELLGLQTVRLVHHFVMWAILAFLVHHVYSSLLVDHWEKNGLMSSIFSGYKFITRRDVVEARDGGIDVSELGE